MRIFLAAFLSLFLLAYSAHAQSSSTASRFFPPDGCVNGQLNIVTWNGEGTSTRCVSIPVCVGDNKLQFDGTNFSCNGGTPPGPACPDYQIALCGPGTHFVGGVLDGNGCQGPGRCVPNQACPDYQIALCGPGTHFVGGDLDANGCQGSGRCVKDDPKKCVAQPTCPDTRVLDCEGNVIGSAECNPPPRSCGATSVQWSQGNVTCQGSIYIDGGIGQTLSVVAPGAVDDNSGKADFTCVDPCPSNGGGTTSCMAMPFWKAQPGATCAQSVHKVQCSIPSILCAPGDHLVTKGTDSNGCPKSTCEPDVTTPKPQCQDITSQIACGPGSHLVTKGTDAKGCPKSTCEPDVTTPKPQCPDTIACGPGSHLVTNGTNANGCPQNSCVPDAIDVTKITIKPFCGGISTQCSAGYHQAWDNGKQANGCPMPAKCVKN